MTHTSLAAPAEGAWRKSSYSDGEGGNCVEIAAQAALDNAVAIRDSKNPRTILVVPAAAFVGLVRHVSSTDA
jgi:hypothetical protein